MFLRSLIASMALAALCINTSFAQVTGVLKGRITSGITNEPLIGATVRVANNPAKGTVSDPDGIYSLVLDTGSHKLLCDYLGLRPDTFVVHIAADVISEKNVSLRASGELLNTVVVSSGRFNQKLDELTVSMEVLKPTLINNKNTTSIETALEQVPGLTIIDNDPQIRGGSGFTFGVGSRVAVVIDGIPLLSGDAGRPEWNYIPVENIAQIEIIKGSSSVLYGSSAINGVINVRSAYPTSTPKTSVNYSIGAYSAPGKPADNWYNGSAPGFMNLNFLHAQIIKKNLDLVIGANLNIDQGYIGGNPAMGGLPKDLVKSLLLPDTIYETTNKQTLKQRGRINFNLRYRSKKYTGLNYGLNGNAMFNKTNMPLAWLSDSTGLYRSYPGAILLENQTLFNFDPFLKYDGGNGVAHSFVGRVFYNNNQIDNRSAVLDTALRTDNKVNNNQSTNGLLLYGQYQLQKKYADLGITFTGGVVGSLAKTHAQLYDSSGTPNNKVTNIAGYLQLDKKFWEVLNISGGVRYEYFQTNQLQNVTQPIYRAGANLRVLKGTWIRMSFGDGFRYPTITERYISTKAGLFGIFPNPTLMPETSKNFEVGMKQGFKIGECMGYLDVAGFQQNYHNTIEYLFGPWDQSVSLFGFKFVNTGDSRVSGADISLACATPETKNFGVTALVGYTYIDPVCLTPNYIYAHTKGIPGSQADTNYSYRSTSLDTSGNVLKYRFKNMVKVDVEVRIYKFAVGASYRYYSKMQNIDKAFADIEDLTKVLNDVYPQFRSISILDMWKSHKNFQVFDARMSYKLSDSHKVSVVCNNVFNAAYFLRPLKIEPPRSLALQYVYTF